MLRLLNTLWYCILINVIRRAILLGICVHTYTCTIEIQPTLPSMRLKDGSSSSTSKYISVVVMERVPRASVTGAISWAGVLKTTGPITRKYVFYFSQGKLTQIMCRQSVINKRCVGLMQVSSWCSYTYTCDKQFVTNHHNVFTIFSHSCHFGFVDFVDMVGSLAIFIMHVVQKNSSLFKIIAIYSKNNSFINISI